MAAVAGFYPDYLHNPLADYRTRIGEQTTVSLADGSIAYLNTDTAIDVTIGDKERRVVLLRGEAEFDVATIARARSVSAPALPRRKPGTRSVVRYEGGGGSVTLLQGKVHTSRPSAQVSGRSR